MTLPRNPAVKSPFGERVAAGLSLLTIVSYAPFSIAALLADRISSVPLGFLLATVFLSMALGTMLSAMRTGTGLVVAPAIGMASIASTTSPETLSTTQLLWATCFAGLTAMWLSQPSLDGKPSIRQTFLNNLPRPVKVGVRGGVGALLATVAVEGVQDVRKIQTGRLYLLVCIIFVISVIALLISEIVQYRLGQRAAGGRGVIGKVAFIFARSAYSSVPLIALIVLYRNSAFPLPTWTWAVPLPKAQPMFGSVITTADLVTQCIVFLSFTALILYVFLTDIPGSVYDFLYRAGIKDVKIQRRIDESFKVTAIMSAINPFGGLFTSVYYAENYVVIRDGDPDKALNDSWTAWFCGLIFLGCSLMFVFVQFPVAEMKTWLLVAVAPALFCLGIKMTARAMQRDFQEELEHQQPESGADSRSTTSFFVPVALTVLLTHFIRFELALPIGIIYYGLSVMMSVKNWREECGGDFVYLFIASCVIALLVGIVRLQALH